MSDQIKVYVVTGTSASGKSGVSKFIHRSYSSSHILNVGDLLAAFLEMKDVGKSRRHIIGEAFLDHFKVIDIFSLVKNEANKLARLNKIERVIVDGVRFPETMQQIRDHFSSVVHIHVVAKSDKLSARRLERIGWHAPVISANYENVFDKYVKRLASDADLIVSTSHGQLFRISDKGKPAEGNFTKDELKSL